MRRRDFIVGLGGAAAVWPLTVRGQEPGRMRRIGVLMGGNEPSTKSRLAAFRQRLSELGWGEGRNLQIDGRFAGGNRAILPKYALELVGLKPDLFLAQSSACVVALQQATRTVPIVFAEATDPVGGGYVESLARPGGNATGFMNFEYGLAGKYLELLKQIAPHVTRAAVLRDPAQFAGVGELGAIQAVAPSLRVVVIPIDVRDPASIERSIASFAREANGGLIVLQGFLADINRETIVGLAARHRLPTVYPASDYVAVGGLASYGPDTLDQYRQAAGYVEPYPQGRSTGGTTGAGADQIRPGDQSQDREGPGPRSAALGTGARHRGY